LAGEEHITIIDHPAGAYWLYVPTGANYEIPEGQTLVGIVVEVLERTGDGQTCACSGSQCNCTETNWMPSDSGSNYQTGEWKYYANYGLHDEEDARDTLCPGATIVGNPPAAVGPTIRDTAFQAGWGADSYCRVRNAYLVFQGTTPP
jgi:hypothetical protein